MKKKLKAFVLSKEHFQYWDETKGPSWFYKAIGELLTLDFTGNSKTIQVFSSPASDKIKAVASIGDLLICNRQGSIDVAEIA